MRKYVSSKELTLEKLAVFITLKYSLHKQLFSSPYVEETLN